MKGSTSRGRVDCLAHLEPRLREHALDRVVVTTELRADRADRPALGVMQAQDLRRLLRRHRPSRRHRASSPSAVSSTSRLAGARAAARRRRSPLARPHSSAEQSSAPGTPHDADGAAASPSFRHVPSTLAFSRVGSNVELDGDGGVEAAFRFRQRRVRYATPIITKSRLSTRFEARPFGVFDHARLRRRLPARRRSAAQSRQHAPTAAHDPQNACTSTAPHTPTESPVQRTAAPYGAAGHARRSATRFHSASAFSRARHEGSGVSDPGLHLLRRVRSTSSAAALPTTMRSDHARATSSGFGVRW